MAPEMSSLWRIGGGGEQKKLSLAAAKCHILFSVAAAVRSQAALTQRAAKRLSEGIIHLLIRTDSLNEVIKFKMQCLASLERCRSSCLSSGYRPVQHQSTYIVVRIKSCGTVFNANMCHLQSLWCDTTITWQ